MDEWENLNKRLDDTIEMMDRFLSKWNEGRAFVELIGGPLDGKMVCMKEGWVWKEAGHAWKREGAHARYLGRTLS